MALRSFIKTHFDMDLSGSHPGQVRGSKRKREAQKRKGPWNVRARQAAQGHVDEIVASSRR
jgi:hypothetical protein